MQPIISDESPGQSYSLPPEMNEVVAEALRRPAPQQPPWPDPARVRSVTTYLNGMPPLVPESEVWALRQDMEGVARGEAFLLQAGDCAETFAAATPERIRRLEMTLRRMAAVLGNGTGRPVVGVGRIAGQYAKPRSGTTDALGLPVYRGDIVNSVSPDPRARIPEPGRMIDAYRAAQATLEVLRAESPNCLYTSHEALLLDYECALLAPAGRSGRQLYGGSAHFLWIGERTRGLDGAHMALAELLANPVGVKVGPGTTPAQAAEYADRLDPDGEPGRLTLISRMGSARVRDVLPALVERVTASGHQVVWQCDPMHGNTGEAASGYKTRNVDHIVDEIDGFFEVHRALGTHPGGLHLEITGDAVTECVGGPRHISDEELVRAYESTCDPRLNAEQALEVAHHTVQLLLR